MLREILEDNGGKEVPVLLTYLIPFTFNPIYLVNALRHLDRKLFPRMSKSISEYLNELLAKGLDPLTALLNTSEKIRNDIVSRLLANYVYVARNVGSATMLTVTFLEKALESIQKSWEDFRNFMNVIIEVEVVLVMTSIIGMLLAIFNPQGIMYLAIIPLSLFFLAIASLTGYVLFSPSIGNPYNEFGSRKGYVVLYYSIITAALAGYIEASEYSLQITITTILIGLILEYKVHMIVKTFTGFIDELSAILNNIEIGYPGTPSINRLLGKYRLKGRIGRLLKALNKGVSIAGETGLRGSFNRIVNVLNSSYRSFIKYKVTANTYILLIITAYAILVYTAHSITGFYGNSALIRETIKPNTLDIGRLNDLTVVSAFLTPISIGLSYRPRMPPILTAGLSALAIYMITHFL
ncbi:MAG: hypothetical protein F7B60_03405 [Desulfurococcales archaeon]|nr:hypothetical protein [Desulfurococcales archaeon]